VAEALLEPGEFSDFLQAIHGHRPFPWQARLMERVAREGWPSVLDLPTGSGKTAAIDVAVFRLALEQSEQPRRAPLRILYVVDRRTIVDQAYKRAQKIAKALDDATTGDGVVGAVKARLARFAPGGRPLATALLRGAIAKSDAWARSPDQPLIAVSTVDQVGSRLLFRGYGVSDSMKPVHAGLLGNDVLYLLDEVHLSHPFRETLGAIRDRYHGWAERELDHRFEVVEMSATPGETSLDTFGLAADDREDPILSRRLSASKPTTLALTQASGFLGELETQVRRFLAPGLTVAVVVNRVAAARRLQAVFAKQFGRQADVVLITGRMRPLDRERAEASLLPRIEAGRTRTGEGRALIVVATQCIEAGADFDFDALVTECASLDALRQRFGRLDRLGDLGGAGRGVVIARTDALAGDPVYGDALGKTWEWLGSIADEGGGVDFGLDALPVPDDASDRGLLAPKPHAPVLLPAHLDAWVQTFPVPVPDPEIALWLHGPNRSAADVLVVWRADLTAEALERASEEGEGQDGASEAAVGAVAVVPPASGEALPVPLAAARRWLRGLSEPDVFDVEGAPDEVQDESAKKSTRDLRVLLWRGEDSRVVGPCDIYPGATIVVPATYGGIEAGTWSPGAEQAVDDLGELAVMRQRGRVSLRLHPSVVTSLFGSAALAPPTPTSEESEEDVDDLWDVRGWLERFDAGEGASEDVRELLGYLRSEGRKERQLRVERLPRLDEAGASYFVVTARRRRSVEADEVTTEDDSASFTGREITLRAHMAGVGELAAEFAARSGLPPDIAHDVRLAGRWHDAGKADPRFQRLLHGGSGFKALVAKEPLAKSRLPLKTPKARREAQQRSGYPWGTRHEVMSIALMASGAEVLRTLANDWDLVQHLVASHHGRCRPLAPVAPDEAPVMVRVAVDGVDVSAESAHGLARLDSGIGERFWRMVRRYGWWGLAWLEASLRLGDHRRSEREQRSEQLP